jgi:hypothetical protein
MGLTCWDIIWIISFNFMFGCCLESLDEEERGGKERERIAIDQQK